MTDVAYVDMYGSLCGYVGLFLWKCRTLLCGYVAYVDV